MEILSFNKLSNENKEDLYNFIISLDEYYNKSLEEMIKLFESEVFNYGENVFVIFENGCIKGTMSAITRETKISGQAYITDIYIEESTLKENFSIFSSLITKAEKACDTNFTKKVVLGIKNKIMYLSPYIERHNFKHIHDAIIMKYDFHNEPKLESNTEVEFISLTYENKDEFRTIHNEAFRGSANAATLSEEEVQEFIFQYKGNEELIGIVKYNSNNVGIYMLADIDNEGWIDNIGILNEFRGNGIGKAVVRKSVEILKSRNIDIIKLLVISSNKSAYRLYNKYGFKEELIFSKWFEVNRK